ncbi:hypothetical protein [Komarekiella delphini-convector]|nr:hypothetical protein [Komarekiella delphini-convector]
MPQALRHGFSTLRLRQRLERVLSATRCANERRQPPPWGGSP